MSVAFRFTSGRSCSDAISVFLKPVPRPNQKPGQRSRRDVQASAFKFRGKLRHGYVRVRLNVREDEIAVRQQFTRASASLPRSGDPVRVTRATSLMTKLGETSYQRAAAWREPPSATNFRTRLRKSCE
jgi:hypothetical protein